MRHKGGAMALLKAGMSGPAVSDLQSQLEKLGFDAGGDSGEYTAATETAVSNFQRSAGLEVDGVAGPNTIAALSRPNLASNVTDSVVCEMFPNTPPINIHCHLPFVLQAMFNSGLADKNMMLMALATIRAEAEAFQPVEEQPSPLNTSPGAPPFDKYNNRAELGNGNAPDGELFRGRGFVQLTGRANYEQFGQAICLGDQLLQNPELAGYPDVAARILAAFLGNRGTHIRNALSSSNLAQARQLVNGGTYGLDKFRDAFQRGQAVIPDNIEIELNPKPPAP
jgi:putative chitinase